MAAARTADMAKTGRKEKSKMRILVAEDEPSLSKVTVHMLEKQGYEAVPAYDGEETLRLIAGEPFDLILLDIMMPKKDGLSVLKEIRAAGNSVKVIMLTAKGEVEDRVLGFEHEADDYVPKPFDYRELFARIGRLLKGREEKKDLAVGDVVLLGEGRLLVSAKNGNSRCAVTEAEERLLRALAAGRPVPDGAACLAVKGDGTKLSLYVSYINNKLRMLSSGMRIAAGSGGLLLEGTDG